MAGSTLVVTGDIHVMTGYLEGIFKDTGNIGIFFTSEKDIKYVYQKSENIAQATKN